MDEQEEYVTAKTRCTAKRIGIQGLMHIDSLCINSNRGSVSFFQNTFPNVSLKYHKRLRGKESPNPLEVLLGPCWFAPRFYLLA